MDIENGFAEFSYSNPEDVASSSSSRLLLHILCLMLANRSSNSFTLMPTHPRARRLARTHASDRARLRGLPRGQPGECAANRE